MSKGRHTSVPTVPVASREEVEAHARLVDPQRQPGERIRYVRASTLRHFREHAGDLSGDRRYLRAMRNAGVHFSEDHPLILGVYEGDRAGEWYASVAEGNHRLALCRGKDLVPYVVRYGENSGLGVEYDGSLGLPDKED